MLNRRILITTILIMFALTGCSAPSDSQTSSQEFTESISEKQYEDQDIRADLIESCKQIYLQAMEAKTIGSLDTIQHMVSRLGEKGYAVVDQENQVNMENSHLAEEFCDKAGRSQEALLRLVVVLNNGGFVEFDLSTKEGKLDVTAKSLWWKEEELVNIDTDHFQAHRWNYSKNGYLFFEKYYMEGFAGPYNHVDIRIKPLDQVCRELNRKYLLPAGYRLNNLFISDWTEPDFQTVNFYDMFDILRKIEFPTAVPYSSNNDGEVYQLSQEEVESVIMPYFNITSQTLQEKIKYTKSSKTYEYRPRGLYDNGAGTGVPYPEVINYEYKDNGTIELTVNAVWPEQNLGTAFQHKTVIRPLEGGRFQYVSNQVIKSENNVEPEWYVERLTDEEWRTFYKDERRERRALISSSGSLF